MNKIKEAAPWPISTEMKPEDYEINRWIEKLDEVAIKHEAKWGIDKLPLLVEPELAAKWDAQINKLNKAIEQSCLNDVRVYASGMIRAWEALDKSASENHKPNKKDVWDVKHPESGRVYRICKNNIDARGSAEEGICVYSLQEVVRILEANQLINVVKEQFPGAEIKEVNDKGKIDWSKGDDIKLF